MRSCESLVVVSTSAWLCPVTGFSLMLLCALDSPLYVRRVEVPYTFEGPFESPLLEKPRRRCNPGKQVLRSDLKEGMHAMKRATATSTHDQFIAFTNDPVGVEGQ